MLQASCRMVLLLWVGYAWIWPASILADDQTSNRLSPDSFSQAVSFLHDVVPILTREGCNSGACHGTPSGKNGFRLSLRGYDPSLDFQSLTRDIQGRRIDHTQPDASMILLKATGQIPHESGRRLTHIRPL